MAELEQKSSTRWQAALLLHGFPAEARVLIPCPLKVDGIALPVGAAEGVCAACQAHLVRPIVSLLVKDATVACWKCLRAAFEAAKQMAGAPQ